jgi:nucleoside-diphosphate-sugar epimerase
MRIFLAGATGAIGRCLVPLLVHGGHTVVGTTRSAGKAAGLEAAGAEPVIVDVFDGAALARVVAAARPELIIHQLTDLPQSSDSAALAAASARNARLREEGTANLVAAATAASVPRLIAQSIAFAYATGPTPHGEEDPLDSSPAQRTSVAGVMALERLVTQTPGIDGLVLRYGRFYGPGTWQTNPARPPAIHVDAAAQAAVLAVTRGPPGIYNIADDDGIVSSAKARRELGFTPGFRISA